MQDIMSKDNELDAMEERMNKIVDKRKGLGGFDTNAEDILAIAEIQLALIRKLRDPYGFRRRK